MLIDDATRTQTCDTRMRMQSRLRSREAPMRACRAERAAQRYFAGAILRHDIDSSCFIVRRSPAIYHCFMISRLLPDFDCIAFCLRLMRAQDARDAKACALIWRGAYVICQHARRSIATARSVTRCAAMPEAISPCRA